MAERRTPSGTQSRRARWRAALTRFLTSRNGAVSIIVGAFLVFALYKAPPCHLGSYNFGCGGWPLSCGFQCRDAKVFESERTTTSSAESIWLVWFEEGDPQVKEPILSKLEVTGTFRVCQRSGLYRVSTVALNERGEAVTISPPGGQECPTIEATKLSLRVENETTQRNVVYGTYQLLAASKQGPQ